jgi:Domain of unknown function (DUF4232)
MDMGSAARRRTWLAARRVLVWLVLSIAMVATGSCAAPAAGMGASPSPVPNARLKVISFPLGGEVDDLAAGGGYVWAFLRDTGALIRVDQGTGRVQRFALGVWRGMPVVTAATRHAVWLANQHSTRSDLIRVNAATGRIVARPRVPGRSGPIRSLTAAYGSLWILVPDAACPPGWRVLLLDLATNRVNKISANIAGSQFTGHTASIWADAGKIWVTGSQDTIVSLNPRTLAIHTTPIAGLSEGLVFGRGYAWRLANDRPSLAMIDPRTGQAVKTFAVPPPSATGDDGTVVGTGLLWVFRGSDLTVLGQPAGQPAGSSRVDPLAGSFGTAALVTGRTIWYLAQAPNGTSLDRVGVPAARSAASRARSSSVSPPAPGTTARAPVCAISQLEIMLTRRGGAVTGEVGGYLRFANTGHVACQLHGWPTVTAVTVTGPAIRAVRALHGTMLGGWQYTSPPRLRLAPGAAYAVLAAGDSSAGAAGSCPAVRLLRVAPPARSGHVTLSARLHGRVYLPACNSVSGSTEIEVSAVVPLRDLAH